MIQLSSIPIINEVEEINIFDFKQEVEEKYPNPEVKWNDLVNKASKVKAYKFKYQSNNHSVTGFLMEPRREENKINEKHPCIIYNRGGNREYGKVTPLQLFGKRIYPFVEWGYLTIISQYSEADGGEGKDEYGGQDLDDVINLKQILDNYDFADKNKLGMVGASRGGLMTYLASAKVDWIKVSVIISGLSNIERNIQLRPEMYSMYKEMFDVDNPLEIKKRIATNYIKYVNPNNPFLLIHGTKDMQVSILDTLEVASEFDKIKIPYKKIIFEDGDHGLDKEFKEVLAVTKSWLNQHLQV